VLKNRTAKARFHAIPVAGHGILGEEGLSPAPASRAGRLRIPRQLFPFHFSIHPSESEGSNTVVKNHQSDYQLIMNIAQSLAYRVSTVNNNDYDH
jgi:hypothetical protein